MKKLTVNEQEELFAQDCKLINLRYEYNGTQICVIREAFIDYLDKQFRI